MFSPNDINQYKQDRKNQLIESVLETLDKLSDDLHNERRIQNDIIALKKRQKDSDVDSMKGIHEKRLTDITNKQIFYDCMDLIDQIRQRDFTPLPFVIKKIFSFRAQISRFNHPKYYLSSIAFAMAVLTAYFYYQKTLFPFGEIQIQCNSKISIWVDNKEFKNALDSSGKFEVKSQEKI